MSNDAELAEAARSCRALDHAHLVAGWVGDGRNVTEEGMPSAADVRDMAHALGVPMPENGEAATDQPELFRAWTVALNRDLITFSSEQRATTGAGVVLWASLSDDELLEHWVGAFVAAVAATLGIEEDADAVELCAIALDAVEECEPPATAEQLCAAMEARFREEYEPFADHLDSESMTLRRESSEKLLAEFAAFGIVDARLELTELGLWGLDELDTWNNPDADMLSELTDMLLAEGVDPNDTAAMQSALEGLLSDDSLLDDAEDEDEDDFTALDLKEAFDLPDGLPPLALPDEPELADAARAGELPPVAPDSGDGPALATWSEAFYDLLAADAFLSANALDDTERELELDFTGLGSILAVLLFLGRNSGMALDELDEVAMESCGVDLEPEDAENAWESWVAAYGNPVRTFLDRLAARGAAGYDEHTAWLCPLGLYAVRERMLLSDVEVPVLPPVERMNAAELVSLVEYGDEQELADFSSTWLGAHEAGAAAGELLAVAADGDPGQRVVATAIVNEIEPAPREHWHAMLGTPSVRPYAKIALARIDNLQPDEAGALEPTEDDLGWLLADTLASTVGGLDDDEIAEELEQLVVPAPEQAALFDGVWRCGHPHAHEVLTVIGKHHPDTKTAKAARKAAFKASPGNQY